jgi:hypothetical protein
MYPQQTVPLQCGFYLLAEAFTHVTQLPNLEQFFIRADTTELDVMTAGFMASGFTLGIGEVLIHS